MHFVRGDWGLNPEYFSSPQSTLRPDSCTLYQESNDGDSTESKMSRNESECLSSGHELEQLSPKGVKDIRKMFEQGNSTSAPNYKSMMNTSNSPAFSNPSTPRSSVNLPRNAPRRPSKPAKLKSKAVGYEVDPITPKSPHMPPALPPRSDPSPSIPPPSIPPPSIPTPSIPPCSFPPPPLPCRPRSSSDHSSASDTRSASVSSLGTQDPPPHS